MNESNDRVYKVTFKIEGGEDVNIFAVDGENVLELARTAGVFIDAPCSGNGTCGNCRVTILEEIDGQLSSYQPLACQAEITGDAVITVPDVIIDYIKNITTEVYIKQGKQGDATEQQINHGEDSCVCNNEDSSSALSQDHNKHPSILPYETEEHPPQRFGLAIDIGTTTVSALLVEISGTGSLYAKATTGNAQIRYGADVINRIIEQQKPGGIKKLQDAIVQDTLIPIINELCTATGVNHENITRLTVAANTTMNHLLLGVDANSIRIEPYEPAFLEFEIMNPASIGINVAPDAQMLLAPNVGSYVGGDITAGILGTGASTGWQMWPGYGELSRTIIDPETGMEIDAPNKMTLLIDLGTNGEIVLSNREFMMACACSAGPAFEGGDISCGMRATHGAIEKFRIDADTMKPVVTVIGSGKPAGLCGSGLIDVVAELFRMGIINGKGKINVTETTKQGKQWDVSPAFLNNEVEYKSRPPASNRISHDEYGIGSYTLVFAADSATGNDITLTEVDIDNFIRAKGAIFSGILSLLSPLGFSPSDIDDVFIAGGIGSGINIRSAISIGMLPDLPEEKYRYLGNTALDGAYSMLLLLYGEQTLEEVNDIARNITYIDLSTQPGYMDEFIAACFLPHTDETLFPSVLT